MRRMRAGLVQLLCVVAGLVLGLLLPRLATDATVVAVLAAVALIRNLQVKAFASIQLAPTLAAIAAQGPRRPAIARLLRRVEELGAGNFPAIWHDSTAHEPR